jgi:hypothetical protein
MSRLSNSLTVLAGKVKDHLIAAAAAEHAAIIAAMEAGHALIEAKAACKHSEWLPFLREAGAPERKAQRYMRLARTGLISDTVSDLGGIKATLEWAEGLKLPSDGEYLMASVSEDLRGFAWRDEQGYGVTALDLQSGSRSSLRRTIIAERAVFPILYALLDNRHAEMLFQIKERFNDDFHRLLTGEYCFKCESKMESLGEVPITIYWPLRRNESRECVQTFLSKAV